MRTALDVGAGIRSIVFKSFPGCRQFRPFRIRTRSRFTVRLLQSMAPMILRLGYDIEFDIPEPVTIVTLLNVHPSRIVDLRSPDELRVEPALKLDGFLDSFGNRCTRFIAPKGGLRLSNDLRVYDAGDPDPVSPNARESPYRSCLTTFFVICTTVVIVRSIVSQRSRWSYLDPRPEDGPGCRRSVTGYIRKLASAINMPGRRKALWSVHRTLWGVPGLSASRRDDVPRFEYSGAVRNWISRRYWCARVS